MPRKPIKIVLFTLDPVQKSSLTASSPDLHGVCIVKIANAEITFLNGGEERIIRTIVRELLHSWDKTIPMSKIIILICAKGLTNLQP